MDGGHEALDDAIRFVDDLGHRGKAVSGTRCVGHNVGAAIVLGVIHTNNEHGGVSRRSRDDDFLSSTSKMGL